MQHCFQNPDSPHYNAKMAFSNVSTWESIFKKLNFHWKKTSSQCGWKAKTWRKSIFKNYFIWIKVTSFNKRFPIHWLLRPMKWKWQQIFSSVLWCASECNRLSKKQKCVAEVLHTLHKLREVCRFIRKSSYDILTKQYQVKNPYIYNKHLEMLPNCFYWWIVINNKQKSTGLDL